MELEEFGGIKQLYSLTYNQMVAMNALLTDLCSFPKSWSLSVVQGDQRPKRLVTHEAPEPLKQCLRHQAQHFLHPFAPSLQPLCLLLHHHQNGVKAS